MHKYEKAPVHCSYFGKANKKWFEAKATRLRWELYFTQWFINHNSGASEYRSKGGIGRQAISWRGMFNDM